MVAIVSINALLAILSILGVLFTLFLVDAIGWVITELLGWTVIASLAEAFGWAMIASVAIGLALLVGYAVHLRAEPDRVRYGRAFWWFSAGYNACCLAGWAWVVEAIGLSSAPLTLLLWLIWLLFMIGASVAFARRDPYLPTNPS